MNIVEDHNLTLIGYSISVQVCVYGQTTRAVKFPNMDYKSQRTRLSNASRSQFVTNSVSIVNVKSAQKPS